MRTLLLLALLATTPALADQNCPSEYMGDEDIAIMASVRPAPEMAGPTRLAQAGQSTVLYGLYDYLGRVGADDQAQIQSVQPVGTKLVQCPVERPPQY